jgi:hypothetical protein
MLTTIKCRCRADSLGAARDPIRTGRPGILAMLLNRQQLPDGECDKAIACRP